MERDNFLCKLCGNNKETLNVHHHLYEQGKDPWDYSDDVLETYCKKCHAVVEFLKTKTPSVTVVKIIWKESKDGFDLAYVIVLDKKKVILAILEFHHEKLIEILAHIPSNIIKLLSEISNIHHG